MAVQDTSENAFERIVRRDARQVVRRSFFSYLGNLLLGFATPGVLAVLPLIIIPGLLWLVLLILGMVATVYAGVVYRRFETMSSTGIARHFSAVAVLGLGLAITPAILVGGLLYGFGGYEVASAGYWLRHSVKENPPRCARGDGELVVFGGESLLCSKCKRLLKVGFDVPRQWRNVGIVALAAGAVLRVLETMLPDGWVAQILTYPVGLLLVIGIVVLFAELSQYYVPRGRVRTPDEPAKV